MNKRDPRVPFACAENTEWNVLAARKEAEPSIAEMLGWIEYLAGGYDLE